MARNAEKAMTTLARWRAAQLGDSNKHKKRRPFLASECRNLYACEKWRVQVIREIAKKVAQIQNAGLGECRIRDLNDEINKLRREKGHWEDQIKVLGGPDYHNVGPKMLDQDGKEVPGNRGYRYFGAAKELPGVRELFEQEPPTSTRKSRAELTKCIDAAYYGYMDDDDGILIPLEQAAEREAIAKLVKTPSDIERRVVVNAINDAPDDDIKDTNVPSQQQVEEALLLRRKHELVEKFIGHS